MRFLLLLCLAAALAGAQQTPRRAAKAHPEIESGMECAACHDGEHTAWNRGRHGIGQVRCVACHGNPRAKFVAKPQPLTCRSCHPSQFDKGVRNCFQCHQPHDLATRKPGGH